jgi:hypothetical protein
MSAGLPGVGLSGLFFVASALLMLPLEIVRTIRGRSSLERWAAVLRHLAIAATMITVLGLAYVALQLVLEQLSGSSGADHGQHSGPGGVEILPMTPLLITLGVVLLFVCTGKLAQLLSRAPARRRPAPAVHRRSTPIESGHRDQRSHAPPVLLESREPSSSPGRRSRRSAVSKAAWGATEELAPAVTK